MNRPPHTGTESELTLDPATDDEWDALRRIGHRMVDEVVTLHRDIRKRPVWQPVTAEAERALDGALPAEGVSLEDAFATFRESILPHNLGTIHPRFWAWVNGSGTTMGAFADMLAAAMNPNCAGHHQAAYDVEAQVLTTLKQAFGWPDDASGALTSGASMANFIGLACARDWAFGDVDVGATGLRDASAQLVVYACETAHNSIDRAVRLLGIGTNHLRRVPATDDWRMDLDLLRKAVESDREQGLRPICVVATAGTVDQGTIDPLPALAEYCAGERLWLHVDGAYGAVAALSPDLRGLVRGLDRADSLAFDLHKWLHVPIEAGCVFVRNRADHQRPFLAPAAYLRPAAGGIAPQGMRMADFTPQLTRGFRALKAWFTLRVFGLDKLGRLAAQNVRQVRALETMARDHPRLEVLASGPLNTLCFRYRRAGLDPERCNTVNERILVAVQESGRFAPSSTWIGDAFAIRLTVTNHRTRWDDLQAFAEAVVELGDAMVDGSLVDSPPSATERSTT